MDKRIYIKDLSCYKKALSEGKNVKHIKEESYFDLGKISDEELAKEIEKFIYFRSEMVSAGFIRNDISTYNVLCDFLKTYGKEIISFKDIKWEEIESLFNRYLLAKGKKLFRENSRRDSTKERRRKWQRKKIQLKTLKIQKK